MENKTKHNKHFGKNGHLNDTGITIYTEALIDKSRFLLLPELVLKHVEECAKCKESVIELYGLLKNEDDIVKTIKQQKNEKNLENKHLKIQKVNKTSYFRIKGFAVAASLFIIAAVSFVLIYVTEPKHEKIFEKYFEPYPNVITEKGNQLNEDELFNLGMYYYDLKNYDTAIIVFNKLLETDSTNETILFYSGITYLGLNKSQEAISIFSLMNNNKNSFNEQVKWYCSLSYILQDNYQKAIPILQEVKQGKGHYSNRADEILSKID